jgi:hypothetical protein
LQVFSLGLEQFAGPVLNSSLFPLAFADPPNHHKNDKSRLSSIPYPPSSLKRAGMALFAGARIFA